MSVWVIGVRSYSAEVADWARDAGLQVEGFLTPGDLRGGVRALVGTGDVDRCAIVADAQRAGVELTGLVHPAAHVAPSAAVPLPRSSLPESSWAR